MYKNQSISILLLSNLLLFSICDIINLSDYKYPEKDSSDKLVRIAILGTNDFHGQIFPTQFSDPNNKKYKNGGAINLYSYAKILKQQWESQILWLDAGDQFQGTMECMLSDCNIMKDYFNKVGLDAIGLGNHDFDYGLDKLKKYIEQQDYPVLAANIKDNKSDKYLYEEWKNVKPYEVYKLTTKENIKIGVIGLASNESASKTSGDISSLTFEDYYETTKKWENYLRTTEKVDAVLLLTHFGPKCENENEEKMKLQMRDINTQQRECLEMQEIMKFLEQIKNDENIQIDGIIAGHVHDIVHHWISGIPIIESSGADYFNIMYLPFRVNKDDSVTLQSNKIVIEGPIPVCEKIWPDSKNCVHKYEDSLTMDNFKFHDHLLTIDEDISNDFKFWSDIIDKKLENELCETKDEMYLDDAKETLLTNFVTDVGKIITDSDICFLNLGEISSTWYKGSINEIDLFRMFPFNNTWTRFEMTGKEVYHMFQNLAGNTLYPNSGSLQTFNYLNKVYTMKNILLWDGFEEKPLEPQKTYKICTSDFLANGGSEMGKVRKWYTELRNKKDFGIIRESLYKYLKNIGPITKGKFVDENYPRITIDN